MTEFKCAVCEFEGTTLRNLSIHLMGKHELELIDYMIKYKNFEKPVCKCGKECLYKSGLRFRQSCGSKSCVAKIKKEKIKHSEETKQVLREKRLKWMKENPEKTAWRLGNNPSWPERYFADACKEAGLDTKFEIVREKSVFPYFIDFAFVDKKLAVEIDGSQHKQMVERDAKRDLYLKAKGWKVYRIEANLMYKKETRFEALANLEKVLNNISVV